MHTHVELTITTLTGVEGTCCGCQIADVSKERENDGGSDHHHAPLNADALESSGLCTAKENNYAHSLHHDCLRPSSQEVAHEDPYCRPGRAFPQVSCVVAVQRRKLFHDHQDFFHSFLPLLPLHHRKSSIPRKQIHVAACGKLFNNGGKGGKKGGIIG